MKDTELTKSRDAALYECYLQGLKTQTFANMHEAADWCRSQPAPKFYISAESLAGYLYTIRKGGSLHNLHRSTQEKVYDLLDRYRLYVATHDVQRVGLKRICEDLVEEPAPRFYIGHHHAIAVLQRERMNHLKGLSR